MSHYFHHDSAEQVLKTAELRRLAERGDAKSQYELGYFLVYDAEGGPKDKLVREGVYVAAPKAVKAAKVEGPSKKELINELEALVDFPVDGFMGATKEAIASVIALAQAVKTA
jgi:hypothetical protein